MKIKTSTSLQEKKPRRGEQSIMDYVLVGRRNRKAIRDVSVKRVYEICSDHYLLVAAVKEE